jgi:D-alanyl-D-alanine carboxypeptidase
MSRALRLAGGWGAALVSALLLSAILAAPMASPEPAVLAGAVSPSPRSAEAASSPPGTALLPGETLPGFPHWPPAGAGSARPVRMVELGGETATALQQALDRARTEQGLYSLAAGIAIDGRAYWAGASGVALDGVTPLDGNSPFAIASITKTFTAALVLQLVEDGRLELDDSVAAHLPEVGLAPEITVRDLLQHTSGLADLLAPMREPMAADPERRWTGAEVIARLGSRWFAPGADYAYSNSNYVLLGMLVERVHGVPFEQVLERRLLRPLDLDETGVLLDPDAPPLMPPAWASAFGTSGNMYSSASDLLEWALALYGGRVLQPGTLAEMLRFNEDDYGLGSEAIRLGDRVGVGHSGLLRGFTSLVVHLPGERVTLALIGTWQGFDPAGALTHSRNGQPSLLDLALDAAGVPRSTASPTPSAAPPGG